jgi:uncharacterized protein DUF3854
MPLAPHHDAMLAALDIAPTVITARGYSTAITKVELARLGFPPAQQLPPALVVPIYNVRGELSTYVLRPDVPRIRNGRPAKYEFPRGFRMVLDVPNLDATHTSLDDPHTPLWITEGSKKIDALVSHGCCGVGVIGVWNWRGSNSKGGKLALPDWELIALNDRVTYICYDSDVMVKREVYGGLCRLAEFLALRHAHVRYVYLPAGPSGAKIGVDDYLALGHTVEDLLGLATTERRPPPEEPDPTARPIIEIRPDITAVVDAAEAAIARVPDAPRLFQRARQICRIVRGVPAPKWLERAPDAPVIAAVETASLRELAAQAARWHKWERRAGDWEEVLPPTWAMETLLARGAWPFPPLEGVVTAPTLRPDGSLLAVPGYDRETGLSLVSNGVVYPELRARPTLDEARSAIGTLQTVFVDFLWAASHYFSAALAAVLSLAGRYAIRGSIPLYAVRSTVRGAGKSLLVDAICLSATGRPAPRWPQVLEEEEERKRLMTLALDGDVCTHIDNVTRPLGSPALNLALTGATFKDRILGKTQSSEAPLHTVFFASGNNMAFKGDTARRVVPIDLDPRMERPEERPGFLHSPLRPWVQQEHPRLLAAALTILKAYFVADCPTQGLTPFGSFEAWSDLVRQALIWAGEADPCVGRTELEATSDPEFERLAQVLEAWYQCYGTQPQTLKRVLQDLALYTQDTAVPPDKWDDLFEALGHLDRRFDGKRLDGQRLGEALGTWQGRPIDGKRLVKAGIVHHAVAWQIETIGL